MDAAAEKILDYLQLIRTPNLGPRRVQALLARFGGPKAALAALREQAGLFGQSGGKKPIKLIERAAAERELAYGERIGARFLTLEDDAYPLYLREIDSPPPVLIVKGNIALLRRPCFSIVGSRNASAIGSRLSALFARDLGRAGYVIVSGFARGIDTYAHQAALASGTIGVMAGGVDHIYPPENNKLYQQILAQGGAFISEMPLGLVPRAAEFPRRNRLIAGLSLGLLVVEASERSGSLISARYAAEAGRIVFAVPGSPLDPRAKGPNGLIKDGACLADEPQEIITVLAPLLQREQLPPRPAPQLWPAEEGAAGEEDYPAPAADCTLPSPAAAAAAEKTMPQLSGISEKEKEKTQYAGAKYSAGPAGAAPLPAFKDAASAAPPAAAKGELSNTDIELLRRSLSPVPIAIDSLAAATGLGLPQLYLGLMELELSGRLIRHHGGLVSALPD